MFLWLFGEVFNSVYVASMNKYRITPILLGAFLVVLQASNAFAQSSLKELTIQHADSWVSDEDGGRDKLLSQLEQRMLKRAKERFVVYPLLLPGESTQTIAYGRAFSGKNKSLLGSLAPEKAVEWARHHLWIELDISKSKVEDPQAETFFESDIDTLRAIDPRRVITLADFSCRLRRFYSEHIEEEKVRKRFQLCQGEEGKSENPLFDVSQAQLDTYLARTAAVAKSRLDASHKDNKQIINALDSLRVAR
jgi:hypothetical protein